MRARQRAETRDRILTAAIEVFARESSLETPLEAVAEAAGVSKATLFFHFGTRIELLEQMAAVIYRDEFTRVVEKAKPGLRPFLERYFALQRQPVARLLWEIGDVLSAKGRGGPDYALRHQTEEQLARMIADGLDQEHAEQLALISAPAAMLVSRRVAFGQASRNETGAFLDAVDLMLDDARATG